MDTSNHEQKSQSSDVQSSHGLSRATPLATETQQEAASSFFEIQDDEQPSSPFALPFQLSDAMSVIQTDQTKERGQALPAPSLLEDRKSMQLPIVKLASITLIVLIALGLLWATVFAQPAQPLTTHGGNTAAMHVRSASHPRMNTQPSNRDFAPENNTWIPQQLPAGWADANLTGGDALFAERTALTFTDREEGLDFRNVGTLTQHGGTFMAATFILSDSAKGRFKRNDVRVTNNVLFNNVLNRQLIQAVVNPVPHLVQFQIKGQQAFSWVDITYQLYQSQVDANSHRVEGLEMDPVTHTPRMHRMSVLLVRVAPENQGVYAPMGGSGWLVSNYTLDLPTPALPDIIVPA